MDAKLCRQAAEIIKPNSGGWMVIKDTFVVRCIEWLEQRHDDLAIQKFTEDEPEAWHVNWHWPEGQIYFQRSVNSDNLGDALAKAVIASSEEGQN